MLYIAFILSALVTASATKGPCPSQQQALQASASLWPTPTGDIGSYISSYSVAHTGIFGCGEFISAMPTSLSQPYQAWEASVYDWSTSFESTVAAAQSTCVGFVANVVIALPRCGNIAGTTTGSAASSTASSTTTSNAGTSSGAKSFAQPFDAFLLAFIVCAGATGTLALLL